MLAFACLYALRKVKILVGIDFPRKDIRIVEFAWIIALIMENPDQVGGSHKAMDGKNKNN